MHASKTIPQSESDPKIQPEIPSMELFFSGITTSLEDGDVVRIGTSEICEIELAEGPPLHSVIHSEGGVVWIEADIDIDDLLVNGRACRRMSLRIGDLINASGLELTLRIADSEAGQNADETEDITALSAEQLCDRIADECAEFQKLEAARREGWQNLMTALQSVHESEQVQVELLAPAESQPQSDACERLLEQIREMSEMVNGRSLELDESEAELIAATTLLHETQDRITRQIEELLEQISDSPYPNALRASA